VTSGQSNLTKRLCNSLFSFFSASPPHTGRFNCIRHVAPICPLPMQHMLPSAYLNPQHKQHLCQFSHFCTAHGRVLSGMSFPLKIVPPHGGSGPHLIHASLGPLEPTTQLASNHLKGNQHLVSSFLDAPTNCSGWDAMQPS